MRLDYKILWFEDQQNNVEEVEKGLSTRLSRLGFNLNVDWIKPASELNSTIGQIKNIVNDFDLILLDYDLGKDSFNGADIAKKLRRSNFLTDIIFYSSASPHDLRQYMFNQHVDGVFCINRNNLQSDSFDIIQNRIRKILDINHMRGIVMEVVSEFDESINDLALTLESQIDCNQKKNEIYSFIQEKINTLSLKNDTQIKEIINHETGCNFENLLNHRACSSFIKYEILKKMLEDLEDKYNITNILEVLKKYNEEVISPRNQLAHVKPTTEKGKTVFKAGDKIYGENEFKLLRQNLLNHRDNFCDLKNLLINGNLEEVQRE
jgi:predicted DNA-binding protein/CheY-like chemotaxis protein